MAPFLYASLAIYSLALILSLAGNVSGRKRLLAASMAAMAAGLVVHSAGLAVRIASTGHAPMASMDETLVFYGWTVVLVSVFVALRYRERLTELLTLPAAMASLAAGAAKLSPGKPLTLILKTRWFELHVTSSFAAYALFTLAFSGAVLYLVYEKRKDEASAALARRLEDMANKAVLWGFFLFSVSMFSGAVWGYLAWGAYWMWEPKMLWSFIVWFYYAGAMHAYYVKDWRGKGLAIATVIGFVIVAFTYLGVSLLMKSSHSF